MKPNLGWTLAAGLVLFAGVASGQTPSYSVTNAPGWNLIANQLDNPNGNGIRTVIPSAPPGSLLRHFNLTTKAFDSTELFTAAGGWLPGTNILNSGDGLEFSNASGGTFTMTFSGNPHVPVLPLNVGTGMVLVARQTNAVANVTNILGYPPPNNTIVYEFIPGAGHDPNIFASSNYTVYALKGGAWNTPPGPPSSIRIGESVWVTTNGSPPTLTSQPKSQTICPNGRVIFTAAATGSPPLSFQWFYAGGQIIGATDSSYTIPVVSSANNGNYFVQVSNPLGTATSSNAVLTVGDFTPPVLTCPTNIVTGCRGVGGTTVTFTVGIVDNCDPKPTVTTVPASGSVFPPGTTTVIATGTDASGNTATCSFTVTVVDTTPPTITCPPDRAVAATSAQGAQVFYTVDVSDNCDPNPTVTSTPASGSVFPIGTTTVLATAKDSTGNSSSCTFNITVVSGACCVGKFWGLKDVTPPPGRYGHAMAYDSARGRVVLFGGNNASGLLGDTWEWDGTSWTLMSSNGPAPREFAAMDYDTRIGRVVLYGGYGGTPAASLSDTWEWDGTSWQSVAGANGPGPRYDHAMAYDSARGRSVLFGGIGSTGSELGDVWEFDGTQWAPGPTGSQGPGPRTGHAMAYGSAQKQLLLFGGEKQSTNFYGDTWKWDGNAWTLLASNGPSARSFHATAYNDNCDSIVMYGGYNGSNYLSDTWEWDGRAWGLTATNNPLARGFHAMAHDSANNLTVLFGGNSVQGILGDTRVYGPDSTPPQVLSIYAACGEQRVLIAFSKPMDPASAQNINNYSISCAGVANQVLQAVLTDDGRIVVLTLAQPISGSPTVGCCSLIISVLRDTCGHILRGFQGSICCTSEPCTRGSAGPEYWLTFPGNYAPDATNPPAPQLFIAGSPGVVGAVSMPLLTAPFVAPFTIPSSGMVTVTLPAAADLGNANDVLLKNGIHVTASQPVSVYGLNHIKYTTDAYLGLSTKALGQTYLVLTYQNQTVGVPELNGVQFAVAATADGTTVTILPSQTVGAHPAGIPFNLTMNRGQTYQLRNTNDAPADLTGTIIVADQPIAVFGSHQCANIPNANTFFCDYLVEQIPPTDVWGRNFITVPLATRLNGDTFHFLAMFNGTTVQVNGSLLPGSINRGQFYEVQLLGAAQITSSQPILVAQYADSSDFDSVPNSDPFMVLVPPTVGYSQRYTVQTPTVDFSGNYLNLMAPAAAVGQINLDGAALSPALFSPVGASGYSSAQVAVGTGPHTLFSSNSLPFGLIAYGWNLYDSYGYPGGTCSTPQGQPRGFTCPPTNVVVQAGAGCLGAVPDLSSQVGNGALAVAFIQNPPAGTLLPVGTFPISLVIVDQFGTRTSCSSSVTVTAGTSAGLQCPQNIFTNCSGPAGQVVTYEVGLCNTNFTLVSTPPSGSLFPPGVTVVSCVASNAAGTVEKCTFSVTVNCVTMGISQAGGNLTINWTGTGTLQKASNVNGPWITLSNTLSPYRISISGTQGFFRVKQ